MKNKQLLVFSILMFGLLTGCSNHQQEEHIKTQNAQIKFQKEQLNYQYQTIYIQKELLNILESQLSDQYEVVEYVIQKGDSILQIAIENDMTMDWLITLNPWLKGKDLNLIYPNDVIRLN